MLPVLLASALTGPGCASTPPAAAIHAHDWDAARASVAGGSDTLAATLVTYLRLLAPEAPPEDIADFLAAHPDWPNRAVMHAGYDAGLASDADDAQAASLCLRLRPGLPAALERCAIAARASGDGTAASAWARAAWSGGIDRDPGDAAAETQFLAEWGDVLTDDDHWRRFELLSPPRGTASEAAAREVARLRGTERAIATARVALAAASPEPLALFASVPLAGQGDPALVLLVARRLRHNGANDDAVAFWRLHGFGVERDQPAALQAAFWVERDGLARALLAEPGHEADAFALADDRENASLASRADALFLAGWIALRRLGQPRVAAERFAALGGVSASVTTRARASYWLARAEAAGGDRAASLRDEAEAAAFPTTFYGQCAIRSLAPEEAYLPRLRASLAAAAAPRWTPAQAMAFASGEMPRAAVLLVAWGEARHAKAFLGEADSQANGAVGHALAAELAVTLGLPDEAVAIARRAGREGRAMPPIGWPRPVTPPPPLPAALLLGVMRQESGFDPLADSPSGALGLMQLLPTTAASLAGGHGFRPAALTEDPWLNMRLGSAYLDRLLTRFDGNVPVAVAAYNAGPHRVAGWPAAPPCPPGSAALDQPNEATIDWIESIPVAETRNYVQRVLENQSVYAALADGSAGTG